MSTSPAEPPIQGPRLTDRHTGYRSDSVGDQSPLPDEAVVWVVIYTYPSGQTVYGPYVGIHAAERARDNIYRDVQLSDAALASSVALEPLHATDGSVATR